MTRTLLIVFWGLFVYATANAQMNPDDYFQNNSSVAEESALDIISSDELFLVPLSLNKEPFARLSDFNFSSVRYLRRGYGIDYKSYMLDNIKLSSNLTSSIDYSLWSGLRRSGISENESDGLSVIDGAIGSVGGTVEFSSDILDLESANRVNLYMMNRKAKGGGYISSVGNLSPKLKYSTSLWGRWGRDNSIKGVFSDEVSFSANLSYKINDNHSLTFFVIGSAQENGLRTYATKELFDLTANKYYNPSWGDYNGKERNSKVVKRFQPLMSLNHKSKLSEHTDIQTTISYRFGESNYSALSWFDAETPYPDYYRNLPSYAENPLVAEIIEQKWREGPHSIRQIDWGAMYEANKNRNEGLAYLLEDRVENVSDLQVAINGITQIDKQLKLSYGMRFRNDNAHFYKRAKDLLGGKPFEDLDQYLNNYPFDNLRQNNLQTVGRLIGKGDRFGYNYKLNGLQYEVFTSAIYRKEKYRLQAALELGRVDYQRRGLYEKELFAGAKSYGKSTKTKFNTYSVKALGTYYFSPRSYIALNGMLAKRAPQYGEIFISPNYSNSIIGKPKEVGVTAIELDYGLNINSLNINVVGYLTQVKEETEIYRYYDDISSKYSNMIVGGIDKQHYGVELTMEYELSARWYLTAIAAIGRYKFSSDQNIDILEDATQKPYVTGAKAYMKGYKLGGTPEQVASLELKYNSYGWQASATYSFMGGRYITPNPLWRMERAYNLATSAERYDEFVGQEKLSNANVLNLFLLKSFEIKKCRLTAMISINNLLGNKDIIYNGYEQMRIMRRGYDVNRRYTPFDRRYLYSYGRTFYASITVKF